MAIWLNPILIRTSKRGKGGAVSFPGIRRQIELKCKQDSTAWVTTMFDFYGLPPDFPGWEQPGSSMDRALIVQRRFQEAVARDNFIANLLVHEFEGLLFSFPSAFGAWFDEGAVVEKIALVRREFVSPEHIDDGKASAPSKRLTSICDGYEKVAHGALIALDIGLERIRRECPLFDGWLRRLESLAPV